MDDLPDYSKEEPEDQSEKRRAFGQLCVKMAELLIRKEELEEELKEVKKEHRKYEEDMVPEMMAEMGMASGSTIVTEGGIKVKLKEEMRASFPKDEEKAARAMAYLKETGNEGLVKREFIIRYGRDATEWADGFAEKLKTMGIEEHGSVEESSAIHHQTLLKFLRDQLKSGKPVPLEAFGAFVQKTAKITRN